MRLTEITDFEAPELDVYARLTEAQLLNRFEPKKGMFIAESPKVILRALDAGCRPVSLLAERNHINDEAREAIGRCGDVPVYTAELEILTKLTGFQLTRGMLCAMYRPRLPSLEEVTAGARRVTVLENVQNPTNVGAIFRSAAALGMVAVLLTRGCSDPLYRRSCLSLAAISPGTVSSPTRISSLRARVMAVYSTPRTISVGAAGAAVRITAGYSLPCDLCTVMA